jgi:hypothetical protein
MKKKRKKKNVFVTANKMRRGGGVGWSSHFTSQQFSPISLCFDFSLSFGYRPTLHNFSLPLASLTLLKYKLD